MYLSPERISSVVEHITQKSIATVRAMDTMHSQKEFDFNITPIKVERQNEEYLTEPSTKSILKRPEKRIIAAFDCDPNFCSSCGSILPLPDQSESIRCKLCGAIVSISNMEGVVIVSEKYYNQDKLKTAEERARMRNLAVADDTGPTVRRTCSKCGHGKMTYLTRQTRSADEGQTVFFTCVKCQFTETEYS